uniref:Uncharacterized protein n=1 Tax=Rhizophora mucronata TaxID=61149 RepID=A0A2P2PYT5_RHIMU
MFMDLCLCTWSFQLLIGQPLEPRQFKMLRFLDPLEMVA